MVGRSDVPNHDRTGEFHAGRVYTGGNPVAAGLLVVINNERLTNNFMSCAINPGLQSQQEGRQAVEP